MRLLLDTHALLCWFSDDPALPKTCRRAVTHPASHIFVSAASAWEISTKFRLGKLPSALELVQDFDGYVAREGFNDLPVSSEQGFCRVR